MPDVAFLVELIKANQTLLLVLGMMVGGEAFLVPVVYLVVIGTVSPLFFAGVALVAGVVSDSLWYVVGRFFPTERVGRFGFVRRNQWLIDRLNVFFDRHSLRILLLSKLVYGTRIVTEVLCGARNVPYVRYLLVDLLGITLWLLTLLAIGLSVHNGVSALHHGAYALQIGLAVFLAVALAIQYAARVYIKRNI